MRQKSWQIKRLFSLRPPSSTAQRNKVTFLPSEWTRMNSGMTQFITLNWWMFIVLNAPFMLGKLLGDYVVPIKNVRRHCEIFPPERMIIGNSNVVCGLKESPPSDLFQSLAFRKVLLQMSLSHFDHRTNHMFNRRQQIFLWIAKNVKHIYNVHQKFMVEIMARSKPSFSGELLNFKREPLMYNLLGFIFWFITLNLL